MSLRSPRKVAATKATQRGHARARTDEWHAKFLAEIAVSMNIRHAAEVAGVHHATAYRRRETDKAFAAAWDQAISEAVDRAEAELYRRAVDGVEKPITVAGEREVIREYPSELLTFLLKGHRPERYRERHEVTGSGGGPVTIRVVYDEPKEEPNAQSR